MLVITGGLVHSVSAPRGEPRDIVIEDDVIADIVAPGAVRNANAGVIDASRRLIIPGLINAHTHSHGGLSKGVGDLWELDLLLNAAPWIGGSRSHEDKHLSALINAVEHVEKGSTACYDLFFEFPAPSIEGMEAVAAAYAKVGLRAVIAPMVADLTFYHAVPGLIDALPDDARDRARKMRMGEADATVAALRQLAATWSHSRDRLRLGIAPTIPHHCTREFMIACRDIAREHDLAMQTHVSEAKYQGVSTFMVFGKSTVRPRTRETKAAAFATASLSVSAPTVPRVGRDAEVASISAPRPSRESVRLLSWKGETAHRNVSHQRLAASALLRVIDWRGGGAGASGSAHPEPT
jgi:guanine deaminase